MAAERTPGLGKSPAHYVQQLLLGDFALTDELNAGCDDVLAMEACTPPCIATSWTCSTSTASRP
jgi:hypothetical protein